MRGELPGSLCGPRYLAVLERTVELLEHPERFQRFWQEQDAALTAGLEDIRAGRVQITEMPEVDLAVVTRVSGGGSGLQFNEIALHSSTSASRILAFDDGLCELYLRYEGWVRYVSRRLPLRPDLAPLAERLSAAEPAGIRWTADGVGTIVTRMRPAPDGCTDLDPAVISGIVVNYLRNATPAWDPFRRGGALI